MLPLFIWDDSAGSGTRLFGPGHARSSILHDTAVLGSLNSWQERGHADGCHSILRDCLAPAKSKVQPLHLSSERHPGHGRMDHHSVCIWSMSNPVRIGFGAHC